MLDILEADARQIAMMARETFEEYVLFLNSVLIVNTLPDLEHFLEIRFKNSSFLVEHIRRN